MALRGLPVAKGLGPMLSDAERQLADITAQLENKSASEQELLDTLVSLAGRVERATAEHDYRFSATRAYDTLVGQRLVELREQPVSGTQTLGEFLQRRLSPAIATVAATEQRLVSLSERVSRASALLRTRVDIATEQQNQQLLEKLTRGQEMQLRLQTTVEGLSIAAISYYVVSLLLYGVKAVKAAGVPLNVEIAIGALIPLVLWGVWRTTRRIPRSCTPGVEPQSNQPFVDDGQGAWSLNFALWVVRSVRVRQRRRGQVVIDAPTHVLGVGLAAVAPPGVGGLGGLGLQLAVDVDQAAFAQQARHPGALLGQEAGVLQVAFPVLQVHLLVRDVDVADQDELALLLELLQVGVDLVEEAELGLLPLFTGGAAREIATDQ
jgi:hypothetical protein